MKTLSNWRRLTPCVLAALLVSHCGSSGSRSDDDADTGTDAPSDLLDATDDGASDVAPDGTTDGDDDTVTDTEDDTTTDVPVDGADVPEDTTTDLPLDGADVPVDGTADPDATDTALDPEADATTGVVGDPCSTAGDCTGVPGAETCLTDIMGYVSFPGGYCSADCTTSADCGPGAECVNFFIMSVCLKECALSSECREAEGYSCGEPPFVGGGPYCIPPIGILDPGPDASTDVPVDTAIDLPVDIPFDTSDPSWEEVVPGPGDVGDACNVDGDCDEYPAATPTCYHDFLGLVTLPGGYCSAECTSAADCGTDGDCVDLLGWDVCLRTCTVDGDCRVSEGYDCDVVPVGTTSDTYCIPASI